MIDNVPFISGNVIIRVSDRNHKSKACLFVIEFAHNSLIKVNVESKINPNANIHNNWKLYAQLKKLNQPKAKSIGLNP